MWQTTVSCMNVHTGAVVVAMADALLAKSKPADKYRLEPGSVAEQLIQQLLATNSSSSTDEFLCRSASWQVQGQQQRQQQQQLT